MVNKKLSAVLVCSGSLLVSLLTSSATLVEASSDIVTVSVGSTPMDVAFSPDGALAYVSNVGSDSVTVIDTTSRSSVATISALIDAEALATTATSLLVRTKSGTNGRLSIVDPATRVTTSAIDSQEVSNNGGLVVSPNQGFAYLVSQNEVTRINLGNSSVSKSATVVNSYTELAVHPSGNTLWATSYNSGTITAFDTSTMSTISTITPGFGLIGITVSSDGSKLYVAHCSPGSVLVFNSSNLTQIDSIPVSGCPYKIALSPTGNDMFVSRLSAGKVTVIDGTTNTVSGEIVVGNDPRGLAVTPDGNFLYVANGASNTVSIIRLTQPVVTAAPAPIVPFWRVTLDPNGGSCRDDSTRTDAWSAGFVGYRYLPAASDCTRSGHTFTGWANTTTPTTVRSLPLLVDPSDGVQRYFVAENLDLIAVWTPIPTPEAITRLEVFANFLCRRCTTAWLIHTPTTAPVSITLDSKTTSCARSATVFNLAICELTNLTPGTHTIAATPTGGISTTTTFTLRG